MFGPSVEQSAPQSYGVPAAASRIHDIDYHPDSQLILSFFINLGMRLEAIKQLLDKLSHPC
jgi:hypothetical protein